MNIMLIRPCVPVQRSHVLARSCHAMQSRSVWPKHASRLMSTASSAGSVTANGRKYRVPKSGQAMVAVCLDGCEPSYLDKAMVWIINGEGKTSDRLDSRLMFRPLGNMTVLCKWENVSDLNDQWLATNTGINLGLFRFFSFQRIVGGWFHV